MSNLAIYSGVPQEHVDLAERAKLRIKTRTGATIVENGLDLLDVKKALGHGKFTEWLEDWFPLSVRTARRWMEVAEEYDGKTDILSVLADSALALLAAPSTPPEVREDVEQRALAGESISVAEIQRLKAEARAARETADRLEAEKSDLLTRVEQAAKSEQQAQECIALIRNRGEQDKREAAEQARAALAAEVERTAREAKAAKAEAEHARQQLAQAVRNAKAEAEDAAQARHDQDAQAAVERKRAELTDLERKAKQAAEQAQRSHAAREQLEADIRRHRDYLAQTQAAEHEWPVMLRDVEAFTTATTAMMHALHGYDHAPDHRVAKEMNRAAQMARQMADALDMVCADRLTAENS